jgi:hypothetical protein
MASLSESELTNRGTMWELDQNLDQPMDEEAGRLKNMYREKVWHFSLFSPFHVDFVFSPSRPQCFAVDTAHKISVCVNAYDDPSHCSCALRSLRTSRFWNK